MNTIEETVLNLRRMQIGGAIGALDLSWPGLMPWLEQFGAETIEHLQFTTPLALDRVRISTRAESSAVDRWAAFLTDVYDIAPDSLAVFTALAEALPEGFEPGLEIATGEEPSGIHARFGEHLEVMQALFHLEERGTTDEVLDRIDLLRQRMGLSDVWGLGVSLDRPFGSPLYELTFPFRFTAEERDGARSRLDRGYELIGVSEAQRTLLGALLDAAAPRAVNDLEVTLFCHQRLAPDKIQVSFPAIPARLVLRLYDQLAPQVEHQGLKLGALTAAAAINDDVVTRLHLTAWTHEPPLASLSLDASRVPMTGEEVKA